MRRRARLAAPVRHMSCWCRLPTALFYYTQQRVILWSKTGHRGSKRAGPRCCPSASHVSACGSDHAGPGGGEKCALNKRFNQCKLNLGKRILPLPGRQTGPLVPAAAFAAAWAARCACTGRTSAALLRHLSFPFPCSRLRTLGTRGALTHSCECREPGLSCHNPKARGLTRWGSEPVSYH